MARKAADGLADGLLLWEVGRRGRTGVGNFRTQPALTIARLVRVTGGRQCRPEEGVCLWSLLCILVYRCVYACCSNGRGTDSPTNRTPWHRTPSVSAGLYSLDRFFHFSRYPAASQRGILTLYPYHYRFAREFVIFFDSFLGKRLPRDWRMSRGARCSLGGLLFMGYIGVLGVLGRLGCICVCMYVCNIKVKQPSCCYHRHGCGSTQFP